MKVFLLVRFYAGIFGRAQLSFIRSLGTREHLHPLPQTLPLTPYPLLTANFAQTEAFFGHLLLRLKK